MNRNYAVQCSGIGKKYRVGIKEFWALQNISMNIKEGERVGIIGRNGAGKSTLLKILSRLVYPTEGRVEITGRVASLLEVGTGFNMELTGRDNIHLNASIHGMEGDEIRNIFQQVVEFSGVGEFIDTPVKHYSSGMYMRLAFAVSAHLDPDILIMDEVLAVGDLSFQKKCLSRVEGLANGGRTIIFVSHSMGDIARFCERVIWIDHGEIRFDGNSIEGVNQYEEEMNPKVSVALDSRRREGTGNARIVEIKSHGPEAAQPEAMRTGEPCTIDLRYEVYSEYANIHDVFACIIFTNEVGKRVFGVPSEVLSVNLTKLGHKGTLTCQIDRLPLVPGRYSLSVALLINNQLVDKVEMASSIKVLDGDFYGTGKLPLKTMGDICVDFGWKLESQLAAKKNEHTSNGKAYMQE
ncbi:ABC transporter ATP-binding protein [Synechococcus sp. CCY 0621]|uniref:ABC transporter ATP-binding protein n=1 Tax=Synechococcus sp. CCY 0621 TaxID=2815603 RepID=UPI001C20FB7D|nr:ABC transporter ATP-binding protein [Synechococcus sp. CCY 0621]